MDVTDKASISKAKKFIEEKEGRLHILVNKSSPCYFHAFDPDGTTHLALVRLDQYLPFSATLQPQRGKMPKLSGLLYLTTNRLKRGGATIKLTLPLYFS